MSWYGRRNDDEEDERITETQTYSTDYDRGGYGYGRGPREDERFTETTTSYYSSDNNAPPPPQVPYPWRPHWDDRERRYIFINEQSGERTWDFPDRQPYGGGGGGYGQERVYEQSTQTYQEDDRQQRSSGGHGHGLAYGALGAAAGLAGGAFLAHEAGNIDNRFEEDKYRVENDVEDFPENAARWTGDKVQEVEDVPQDIEQGFDRFGNRIESGWDNAVDDVEDVPEDVARWGGRKVGDVERFDDNVDNAYDEGRAEGRYDDDNRW